MDKRQFIKGGVAMAGASLLVGFGPPACDSVSKDKAVKYTGLVIDLMKDTAPLFQLLNAPEVAQLVTDKAIPALEKLKEALGRGEIPVAKSFFEMVTGMLGQVANALFQLPESARRDTIIGILAMVNTALRTVNLFVESEVPVANDDAGPRRAPAPYKPSATALSVRKAFEATRFN